MQTTCDPFNAWDKNVSDILNETVDVNISEKNFAVEDQQSVSKDTYDRLMPILILVNLVFEAATLLLTFISACVYALPNMRCATACYLVALNSADTLSGLLVVIKRTRDVIWGVSTPSSLPFAYVTLVGALYVSVSCRRLVYCLSVMVSLERLFVILFPLRARYIKLIAYPKLCVASLVAVTLALHVYLLLKYQVVPSGTGYRTGYTDAFRLNERTFDNVSNVSVCLFSYIPLALCLVFSVALIRALKKQSAYRKSLQESQTNTGAVSTAEKQLSMTIWMSTLLFAVLSVPASTVQIVSYYHHSFYFEGSEHRLYRLVDNFAQILRVASRLTNFLAYLCLSVSFRRNLLRIFCKNKAVRSRSTIRMHTSDFQPSESDVNVSVTIITRL